MVSFLRDVSRGQIKWLGIKNNPYPERPSFLNQPTDTSQSHIIYSIKLITINLWNIPFLQSNINQLIYFISLENRRSVYSPYDPFLATSLAQLQAAAVANAAGNHGGSPGMTDPRLQVS